MSSVLCRASFLLLFVIASASCSSEADAPRQKPTEPPVPVQYAISISPHTDTVAVGLTRILAARVTDGTGATVDVAPTWSSLDPAVATVSAGTVSAIAAGQARIVASFAQAADTARVVVTMDGVQLQISPSAISASLGDTVAFEARLVTVTGDALGYTAVSWSASDSNAIALIGDGRVALNDVGDAQVTAHAGTMTASASVNVFRTPVGSVTIRPSSASITVGTEIDLDARVLDQNGRPVFNKSVTWRSSDTTVATVSRLGTVYGVARGGVMITAISGGKSATATVNVTTQPASRVTLDVNPDTIVPGYRVQAVAIPRDANGQPRQGRTIAYQSSNPSVATIDNSGMIVALAAGATNISAICDGNIATVKLTVQAPRATSLLIVPGAPMLQQGATANLTADVRDQMGQSMSGATVTWSSQAPSVVTVNTTGMITGVALGTGKVTATSAGLSAQVTVTVTTQSVASVQVTPSNATVFPSQTRSLDATARNVSGQPIAGASFAWRSSNESIASVSALGVVTGKAVGHATITATSGGQSASSTIDVNQAPPPPVAAVSVAVNSNTLDVGQSTQAVATLYDALGNVLTGRTVTWGSADSSLATVSTSGLITAVGAGSVTISAAAEGQAGLATITINTPPTVPVASVTVTAGSTTLQVGGSTQLTVVLKDAQGNVLTGRPISYTSSKANVASVSASGRVTGLAAGTSTITVTSGTASGSATITVQTAPPPPAQPFSVTVSVNANSLQVGQSTQATAVVKDSVGNVLNGQVISWTSSNAAVATVSSTGLVSAVAAGQATISANTSGKTGGATVSVTNAPATVASVSVSMSNTTLTIGQTNQATAVAKDANGNVVSGVTFAWSVSSTQVLSVSTGGLVTAVASGSAQVQAKASGITGSIGVTVNPNNPAPPPGPNGLTAPPALPQVYLNNPYPAVTGQTIVVSAGGNLQNALNSAKRGDEIVLASGATFTGNFTLPVKPGTAANGWITIRSDKLSQLGGVGTRVTPAQANLMPRIQTANSAPAIATVAGASGWRIAGVEATISASYSGPNYGIVWLGDGSSAQHQLSQVPTDLVLDRMYIHGQPTSDVSRCVGLNSARSEVSDSYLMDCHAGGVDAQAIAGWNGPGPFKIVNNTLAGSTENVMFGGADPWITNLIPSDIEIRQNYIYTPASWKGARWIKKNLFELKAGRRILVEGNVLDGSWANGQTGWAFMIKTEDQSGRCTWCATSDLTIRYNYIRNAGAGIAIAGREGTNPNPVGALTTRVSVQNNVMDNIQVGIFVGDARFMQVLGNASDVDFTNNTFTSTGAINTFVSFDEFNTATRLAFNNNVFTLGRYGMFGTNRGEGTPALAAVNGGWQFTRNYLVGSNRTNYPATTVFVSAPSQAPSSVGADQATVNVKTAGVIIP